MQQCATRGNTCGKRKKGKVPTEKKRHAVRGILLLSMSGNYISKWLLNVYLRFELFINDIATVFSTRKQRSAGVVPNLYSGVLARKG